MSETAFVGSILALIVLGVGGALLLQRQRGRRLMTEPVLTVRLPPTGLGLLASVGVTFAALILTAVPLVLVMISFERAGEKPSEVWLLVGMVIATVATFSAAMVSNRVLSQGRVLFHDDRVELFVKAEGWDPLVVPLTSAPRFWIRSKWVGFDLEHDGKTIPFNFQALSVADFSLASPSSQPSRYGLGYGIDRVAGREFARRMVARFGASQCAR